MNDQPASHRPIRSFVRREGRLTRGQQRALDSLLPRYGLDGLTGGWDLPAIFGNDRPITLEIGFGNGELLATQAAAHPDQNFIGIEVHRPGVGHLLQRAEREGLSNIRVCTRDALEVLRDHLPAASLDNIWLFFPDPWHKKRHHKRRIVRPEFLDNAATCLKPGGILHMATDWTDYAEQMLQMLEHDPRFDNRAGPGRYAQRPAHRPLTKFEQRGQRLSHPIHDLVFARNARHGCDSTGQGVIVSDRRDGEQQ